MIEAQKPVAGLGHLVQFEWAAGTLRYFSQPGFVTWSSQTWRAVTDTAGQLMAVGSLSEQVGEVSNRDIVLTLTPTVRGYLFAGERGVKVTIWEIERDTQTAALTVKTPPWVGFEDFYRVEGETQQTVTFTLAGNARRLLQPNEGWNSTPSAQARLATGDAGYNLTGPPPVGPFSADGPSYPYIVPGGGGGILQGSEREMSA
jgi:hypothetical protein